MNDEIKEILDNFEKYETRYKLHNETQFIITHREIQILLDYITNLQNRIKELEKINKQHQELNSELREENKELKEYKENATRKHWQQKCVEHSINEKLLQIRIDKVIEVIKNKYPVLCESEGDFKEELLNILQDKKEV